MRWMRWVDMMRLLWFYTMIYDKMYVMIMMVGLSIELGAEPL